ncbi:unnamed protein product, partial [marine sediment metagenome]
ESDMSGTRQLDVLMYDVPEFHPAIDPHKNQHGLLILKLRGGNPFWYETAATASGWHEDSVAGDGTVTVTNPTDRIMHHKWILTVGTYTLPDHQWVGAPGARTPGGAFGSRTIADIEVTSANGGAVVDLDRENLMFRDGNDTNILAQLAGKIFAFPIPPYTPATDLAVTGDGMARLVMPRRWSRPWGMAE